MTAKEAVNRSISHDEIVTIHATDKAEAKVLVSELQEIAFDSGLDFTRVFIGHNCETWAYGYGDHSKMMWRVHINVEAQ